MRKHGLVAVSIAATPSIAFAHGETDEVFALIFWHMFVIVALIGYLIVKWFMRSPRFKPVFGAIAADAIAWLVLGWIPTNVDPSRDSMVALAICAAPVVGFVLGLRGRREAT